MLTVFQKISYFCEIRLIKLITEYKYNENTNKAFFSASTSATLKQICRLKAIFFAILFINYFQNFFLIRSPTIWFLNNL